jgi:hypothetical protein
MPKKRGQLSLDEEKFIRDSIDSMSVDNIASQLNRNIDPVNRYIEENNLYALEEKSENDILVRKLHSKTFWNEILRQFDSESGELEYFENTWIGLIKQFREDVLPAEELQIKQFITIGFKLSYNLG